jgi:hypothetical protein
MLTISNSFSGGPKRKTTSKALVPTNDGSTTLLNLAPSFLMVTTTDGGDHDLHSVCFGARRPASRSTTFVAGQDARGFALGRRLVCAIGGVALDRGSRKRTATAGQELKGVVVAFTDEIDSWMRSEFRPSKADSKSEIEQVRREVNRLPAEVQRLKERVAGSGCLGGNLWSYREIIAKLFTRKYRAAIRAQLAFRAQSNRTISPLVSWLRFWLGVVIVAEQGDHMTQLILDISSALVTSSKAPEGFGSF